MFLPEVLNNASQLCFEAMYKISSYNNSTSWEHFQTKAKGGGALQKIQVTHFCIQNLSKKLKLGTIQCQNRAFPSPKSKPPLEN